MQVVWFKRDLRVTDHQALLEAARLGPVLPLYVLEPKLWQEEDMSGRQYQFLLGCVASLDQECKRLGQALVIKVGDATEVLAELFELGVTAMHSHEETWNDWTYQRDKAVKRLCKRHAVVWKEYPRNGVVRCLSKRDGWAAMWYARMSKPLLEPPKALKPVAVEGDCMPSAKSLGLIEVENGHFQVGGREEGWRLLNSFLHSRGQHYTKAMSSPVIAYKSCSRVSAHLAFGTLSMREVFQAARQRASDLASGKEPSRSWSSALRSFSGRLRWHCHFMQKLEDEPGIEFFNVHPAYNVLRVDTFSDEYFTAWKYGRTGYPMVDACMRALIATGWLNFRMRAMVMSFASYHLWLPWQLTARYLASLFTDYEPGIHYSQVQMQSGTTGINAIRIYNPIKQGLDHDPEGVFIRRWIPELVAMPQEHLHTPWVEPKHLGGYPHPIVDEKEARTYAKEQLYSMRKTPEHKQAAKGIVTKHASRKSPRRSSTGRKKEKNSDNNPQGELPV